MFQDQLPKHGDGQPPCPPDRKACNHVTRQRRTQLDLQCIASPDCLRIRNEQRNLEPPGARRAASNHPEMTSETSEGTSRETRTSLGGPWNCCICICVCIDEFRFVYEFVFHVCVRYCAACIVSRVGAVSTRRSTMSLRLPGTCRKRMYFQSSASSLVSLQTWISIIKTLKYLEITSMDVLFGEIPLYICRLLLAFICPMIFEFIRR